MDPKPRLWWETELHERFYRCEITGESKSSLDFNASGSGMAAASSMEGMKKIERKVEYEADFESEAIVSWVDERLRGAAGDGRETGR
ncbi:hypothetical protein ACFX15_039786 [Malus domestica]